MSEGFKIVSASSFPRTRHHLFECTTVIPRNKRDAVYDYKERTNGTILIKREGGLFFRTNDVRTLCDFVYFLVRINHDRKVYIAANYFIPERLSVKSGRKTVAKYRFSYFANGELDDEIRFYEDRLRRELNLVIPEEELPSRKKHVLKWSIKYPDYSIKFNCAVCTHRFRNFIVTLGEILEEELRRRGLEVSVEFSERGFLFHVPTKMHSAF